MIEGENRLVKHQRSVIHSKIVPPGVRNIFDRPDHVVAEVADGATGDRRKARNLHRLETLQSRAQILHELSSRLSLLESADQEGIATQEGIACDGFAAFNTFQEECVRSTLLELEKYRHGCEKVCDYRLVYRNDI